MEITTPYINTKLYSEIGLRPDQMENEIYIHLKHNLIKKLEGKCYLDYGYIEKIYSITDHDSGIISGENLHGFAKFKIGFTLRLCRPLKSTFIICKVTSVNKKLVKLEDGPILAYSPSSRYNSDIFFTDNNNVLRYKTKNTSQILNPGSFIVLYIESVLFSNMDRKIVVIGKIHDIASDKQIKKYYDDTNKDENDNIVDIKEYLEF